MKKPFETEMDDTRQAVGQIVCLCTTIALHQEFGVGKTRLERIKARIDELENQNTEVIMTPDANGRPSKDKAEAIRESCAAVLLMPCNPRIWKLLISMAARMLWKWTRSSVSSS